MLRPISIAVASLLVITTAIFAAIVPITEHPVAPVSYGEAIGTQSGPTLAAAGSDVLALWTDTTNGRAGLYDTVITGRDAFTPNPPQRIATAIESDLVALCWTGSTYLALSSAPGREMDITLLDRDGRVVRGPGLFEADAVPLSITWNGRRAMVTYDRGGQVIAAILNANGTPMRDGLVIGPDTIAISNPVAAGTTFGIFVASPSPATINVIRFNDAGDRLDAQPIAVGTWQHDATPAPYWTTVAAASDGTRFAVAYADHTSPTQMVVRSVVVDATSLAVQTAPVGISPDQVHDLHLVWDGAQFDAVWDAWTAVYTMPVGSGTPVRSFLGTPGQTTLVKDVVSNGASVYIGLLLANAPGSSDTAVIPIDRGGNASSPLVISTAAEAQLTSAIAPGLVVWSDSRHDGVNGELFATRIDATGAPLGSAVQLSTNQYVSAYVRPQVVFTGSMWFVMWSEDFGTAARVMARRIAADGTLLDAAPFQICNGLAAAVAFNGIRIVVIYPLGADTAESRFNAQGEPIDTFTLIPGSARTVAIASNGDGFFMAWNGGSDYWQYPTPNALDVYGARLDAFGELVDVQPIAIATGPEDQAGAEVASNGRDYLVAWTLRGYDSLGAAVTTAQAQRVDANGTLDGAPVDIGSTNPCSPTPMLGGDANGYWFIAHSGRCDEPDVLVARLDASGAVVDRGTIAVDAWQTSPPSIVASGNGALATYARIVPRLAVPRVFTSRVVALPRHHAASH